MKSEMFHFYCRNAIDTRLIEILLPVLGLNGKQMLINSQRVVSALRMKNKNNHFNVAS